MSRSTISTKEWKCGMKVRSRKRNNIINPDNILTIHELHQYADAGPNINRVTAISDTGHYMWEILQCLSVIRKIKNMKQSLMRGQNYDMEEEYTKTKHHQEQ